MSKLMLLTVYGVSSDYSIGTWQRLVSVSNEAEFLGTMRVKALKELIDEGNAGHIPDDQQAIMLRSLRLRLTDTGLTDMPETEIERTALWERMTNVAQSI